MNCKYCGSSEEVQMTPVDIPGNQEPICLGCWEKFMDAAQDARRDQFNQEDN